MYKEKNIPIPVAHLFEPLECELQELLDGLEPGDWTKPTIAGQWTVKDVAAHLLDGNLRTLSIARDGYIGDPPSTINSNADLVGYLNGLNASFVKAMKRVSPNVLLQLIKDTGYQQAKILASQDPFAQAVFGVSWAGESQSVNWFHMAREYTERWHHQQQIRDALGRDGITTREFYYPVLDTFMRALPFTYEKIVAPAGTVLEVHVRGEAGGSWYLTSNEKWTLQTQPTGVITTKVTIDAAVAWKLFTKSWRRPQVVNHVSIEGDPRLAEPVLEMVAVVA